jgi:hypothetical protein
VDGTLCFTSGATTRKSRNLEESPRCAISAQLPEFDVTFEGRAGRVTDHDTVERLGESLRRHGLAGPRPRRSD